VYANQFLSLRFARISRGGVAIWPLFQWPESLYLARRRHNGRVATLLALCPAPVCHSRLGNGALRAILEGRVYPKSLWVAPFGYEGWENVFVNDVSPGFIDVTSNLHFVLLCKIDPAVLLS